MSKLHQVMTFVTGVGVCLVGMYLGYWDGFDDGKKSVTTYEVVNATSTDVKMVEKLFEEHREWLMSRDRKERVLDIARWKKLQSALEQQGIELDDL